MLRATLRARFRNIRGEASPTAPRNSKAEPSGLITGSNALKARMEVFNSCCLHQEMRIPKAVLRPANRERKVGTAPPVKFEIS